jgi:hypothetical protein
MRNRLTRTVVFAAAVAWVSSTALAQQPPPGQTHDHDAHHREMLQRGAQAMGFDQERSIHHFLLYEDGGAIEVSVKEATDQASLRAVRKHLQEIAGLFKAGDFGKPALTHAQQVPGTADMMRLKERITYQYQETSTGGRVRVVTHDADALTRRRDTAAARCSSTGRGDFCLRANAPASAGAHRGAWFRRQ